MLPINLFCGFYVLYLETRSNKRDSKTKNEQDARTKIMELNNKTTNPNQTLEAVITAELSAMYRYACYRLGERDAAQEVIQELYLKLHSKPTSEIRNLRCYIYRALSNACSQALRERRKICFIDIDSLSDLTADDLHPADFAQEQALISRLLAALPDEQSEVIRLHLHGECTFAEIADILETPLATVKSRYRYGIEHLRQELQKQHFI